jgi:hypothetical protein
MRRGWAGETRGNRNDGRPNGSDVKLRGQGPRGYGSAARRLPACESRDAGGVTPRKLRCPWRLGRRAEAGPRQLLRRVSPRFTRVALKATARRLAQSRGLFVQGDITATRLTGSDSMRS